MRRYLATAAVLLLAGGTVAATAEASGKTAAHPQVVVLITIDTLRTDAVSFMSCEYETTPTLDALAARGAVFQRVYSDSWTVPSMASLFTSRQASVHGVFAGTMQRKEKTEVWDQPQLPATFKTLPEVFHEAGYTTIGVAANRHLQAGSGFERGFDHYFKNASFLSAKKLNHHGAGSGEVVRKSERADLYGQVVARHR